ncbi:hypothetical protein PRIPAC_97238 [Pristionchus pacificus]|nr:hypothetical protein PRIPAC_97238 [Pristionchus pacificus]
MRALLLPLLAILGVKAQWSYAYANCGGCPQMPQMPFMPQMPQMPFMPFAPFPPMPPMMPIIPQHVGNEGNGMGGYVTSGNLPGGGKYAAAGSYSNSNGNGPFRTVTYSTGTQTPGGGTRLPYRPYPAPPNSNTVAQQSEKRVKLPNGGELITKTMVEKTPNGQRVSSFSYSQNPLGPVMPNNPARNLPASKLPFAAKERLEQYKTPLEGAEPESDTYIREGSGEAPSPPAVATSSGSPSFAFASQSSQSGQPTVSFTSQSSNGQPPTYSFSSQTSNNGQPAVAFASQSSNAIFD